jgi:predicted phage terminase large subunit-like protein
LATDKGGCHGFALHRVPVAWFAPSSSTLVESWEQVKEWLSPVIKRTNEVRRSIWLQNGSRLDFWSLEAKNPGRGRKYSKVVIDEGAFVPKLLEKWQLNIMPTLTDYNGGALFGSTPAGRRNDFALLDARGGRIENVNGKPQLVRPLRPDGRLRYPSWSNFHAPTWANPYIRKSVIAAWRQEVTSQAFAQEYGAEYVNFGGGVVSPDWCQTGRTAELSPIVLGVDLAISKKKKSNYSAIVAMQRTFEGNVYVKGAVRFRESFAKILQRIAAFAAYFASIGRPVSVVGIEEVAFQSAVVQELLRTTSLPVVGMRPDVDKFRRFLPLAARYEHRLVFHDPDLPPEFTEQITSFTGDDDNEDDFVDAAAYAYRALGFANTVIVGAGASALEAALRAQQQGIPGLHGDNPFHDFFHPQ